MARGATSRHIATSARFVMEAPAWRQGKADVSWNSSTPLGAPQQVQLVPSAASSRRQPSATRRRPRRPARARALSAHRGVQAQGTARRSRRVRLRMRSVQELEALVNERLRVELEQVQDERDRLYERISHCMELKNNMTMLQDQKRSSLKTMVDLGCSFCASSHVRAAAESQPAPSGASRWTASLSGPCQVCAQTRHLVGARRRGPRLPRPDDPGGGDRLQHAA